MGWERCDGGGGMKEIGWRQEEMGWRRWDGKDEMEEVGWGRWDGADGMVTGGKGWRT